MRNKIKEYREMLNRVVGMSWSYEAGQVPYGTRLVIELQTKEFSSEEILRELRRELRKWHDCRVEAVASAARARAYAKADLRRNSHKYDANGRRIRVRRQA